MGLPIHASSDPLIYSFDPKTKTAGVSGCDESVYSVSIPSTVEYEGETYSVTSIRNSAFNSHRNLTSVTIPNSVTHIGSFAFSQCFSLTSIEISNSVEYIGAYAFYSCMWLSSVTIPPSVTEIGNGAFADCQGLNGVWISDLASWCDIDFGGSTANPLYWGKRLYIDGELIKDLVIPNGVVNIGAHAFSRCRSLTSVTIPASVNWIGKDAFEECDGLKEVRINDLKAWCNIEFGNEFSNPLYYATKFYLDGELTSSLIIPDEINIIKNYAFCGRSIHSIIPHREVKTEPYAFYQYNGVVKYQYVITYHLNGGTGAPEKQYIMSDKKVALATPTRVGYVFLGWTTVQNGPVVYPAGYSYSADADIDLYAVWAHGNTITYYHHNDTDEITTDSKVEGEYIVLKTLSRTGYVFKGWALEYGGKVIYAPGTAYQNNADITLHAIWVQTCPTTTTKTILCTNKECNKGYVKTTQRCTKCNGNGIVGTTKLCLSCHGTGKVTTIEWIECGFCKVNRDPSCVLCHGVGGYYYEVGTTCTLCSGTGSLPDKSYDCTNCKGGWVKKTCSVCNGKVNLTVTDNCIICGGTGYAPYTISFELYGGTGGPGSQKKRYGVILTLSKTVPTKEGKAFLGWSTSQNGKVEYKPGDLFDKNADFILYAVWGDYLPGDLNGDSLINSLDGLMLLRYLNGWDIDIATPESMDVNGDGKVNSLDGLILMRYLNGWKVTLG